MGKVIVGNAGQADNNTPVVQARQNSLALQRHLKKEGLLPSTQEKYQEIVTRSKSKAKKDLITWIVNKVHAQMPIGTVLPLRASIKHYLVAVEGYSEEELARLLPKARGRQPGRQHSLNPRQLAVYYAAVEEVQSWVPRTLLRLLPRCGLRIGEMVKLRWEDVQEQDGDVYLVFRGKRDKERTVALGQKAVEILIEHKKQLDPKSPSAWMFPGRSGRAITPHAVRKYTRDLRARHPDLGKLTPHSLRRTYATMMLRHGVNLKYIQELLGHSSIKTTERYLTVEREDLAAAVRQIPDM